MVALVAAGMMGCTFPDMPAQSGSPFPIEPAWALENLGVPRTVRGAPLAAGALAGYTRQIALTSPVSGTVRLTGRIWVRYGPDEQHLNAPTPAEYRATNIACDLYMDGVAQPFSAAHCSGPATSEPIQGCNWTIPVRREANELHFQCIVKSDGQPHAFTVGVTDMVACPEAGGPCHAVEVSAPLRYQGGANIPRPDGLIVYVISD